MDATRDIYRQLAERTGHDFLDALQALPEYKPRPGVDLGRLRITVTVVDGPDVGSVDIDPVNIGDLANITARRAEGLRAKHAQNSKPNLRLVGGDR